MAGSCCGGGAAAPRPAVSVPGGGSGPLVTRHGVLEWVHISAGGAESFYASAAEVDSAIELFGGSKDHRPAPGSKPTA